MFDDILDGLNHTLSTSEDDNNHLGDQFDQLHQEDLLNQDQDDLHHLSEQLHEHGFEVDFEGIENGQQDLPHNDNHNETKADDRLHSKVSFGECSCGGNCHMVCQDSCASACLSEYSH